MFHNLKRMTYDITNTLREREQFLRRALQVAGLGTYVMNVPGGTFATSDILDEIFGLSRMPSRTFDDWVALLHPDDRQMMIDYFRDEVVGQGRHFDKEYRIIRKSDGAERWVHGYGDLEFDSDHRPIVMIGTIQDVTDRKNSEASVQRSESRYRELVDLAVDGILIASHEGLIIEVNRRMCEMTGMSCAELVGKHIRDVLFTPESLEKSPLRFDLLQRGETVIRQREILRADGMIAFVESRTKMMPDGTYQSIYRDISDHKTAETLLYKFASALANQVEERTRELETANTLLNQSVLQLRKHQALLRDMGRMAKVGGWELDLQTGKQIWTDEVYEIHEVDADYEPTGEKGVMFYAPEARSLIESSVRRCIEKGEPFDIELPFITAKGNRRWVHSIGKADFEHGRIYGTFQDVTERRVADKTLREKNEALDQSVAQLRTLAMELTQAEDRERKRLAEILHDNVQQYLAGARMKISLLGRRMAAADRNREVGEALSLLGEALETSRSLTVSLYPPVLLDAGLMPGLRWLGEWMAGSHGLAVKITADESIEVPGTLNSILFQGVRELLFNVVKHAGVRVASVCVERSDTGELRLTVSDQGQGFSPPASQGHGVPGGFGLFHLRERLAFIGGALTVTSQTGRGTSVTITIPSSRLF